jgi:predicted GNAT family acetyltransferase
LFLRRTFVPESLQGAGNRNKLIRFKDEKQRKKVLLTGAACCQHLGYLHRETVLRESTKPRKW